MLFRLVEILRQKTFKKRLWSSTQELNLIETFNYIDKNQTGSISKGSLLAFLNKFLKSSKLTQEDLTALFRRLNLSEDILNLTYLQFVNAILPSETNL